MDERVRPDRVPIIGDEGFLGHLFGALQAGLITESEWKQADRAHRFVVKARR